MTYLQAASVPVIAVTAWQGLFDQGGLKAGQTLLIHGGAGNVGAYAVQLARRAGARIFATAAAEDTSFVRELGADTVIDFQAERFEDVVREADVVLDLVGGETQRRSFKVLRSGGKLISAVSHPDNELAKEHSISAAFFLVKVTSEHLVEITKLIDSGGLSPAWAQPCRWQTHAKRISCLRAYARCRRARSCSASALDETG